MCPDVDSSPKGVLRAEGALFDLDGVLVDSMPIIREIFEGWARPCGLDPAHVVETVHGRTTRQALADLVELWTGEHRRLERRRCGRLSLGDAVRQTGRAGPPSRGVARDPVAGRCADRRSRTGA